MIQAVLGEVELGAAAGRDARPRRSAIAFSPNQDGQVCVTRRVDRPVARPPPTAGPSPAATPPTAGLPTATPPTATQPAGGPHGG